MTDPTADEVRDRIAEELVEGWCDQVKINPETDFPALADAVMTVVTPLLESLAAARTKHTMAAEGLAEYDVELTELRAARGKFDERLSDVQAEHRKALESWERTRARLAREVAAAKAETARVVRDERYVDIHHMVEAELAIARLTKDSGGRPVDHDVSEVAAAVAHAFEMDLTPEAEAHVAPVRCSEVGQWKTHPTSGVMHRVRPGNAVAECEQTASLLWLPAVNGNAHCLRPGCDAPTEPAGELAREAMGQVPLGPGTALSPARNDPQRATPATSGKPAPLDRLPWQVVRLVHRVDAMRDRWAEAGPEMRGELWRRVHGACDDVWAMDEAVAGAGSPAPEPPTNVTVTDCRTDEGVTVGLIDGIIAQARVLVSRDMTGTAVVAALADLRGDEDVSRLMDASPADPESRLCSCSSTTVVRIHDPGTYCGDAMRERVADVVREMWPDKRVDVDAIVCVVLDGIADGGRS